jgi:ribosomal protein S18 acetylase RimI-like enzyme
MREKEVKLVMATITMRKWQNETDWLLIAELLRCMPQSARHLIDLPWRLSVLALDSSENAHVWQHSDGRLAGFAAWQVPWAALDYFVRPGMYQPTVEAAIFDWAEQHFQELDRERGQALPYWIELGEDDQERRRAAEAHGFLLDSDYTYLQFQHSLAGPLTEATLPTGFTLRSLAGAHEAEAYVALHRAAFESTSMTLDWRLCSLRAPQYRPELDLVAVAPDGQLAGFCIGWLDGERYTGQVEPIGVHPNFQHRGLGRALLIEMLRRFKAHHASRVLVETGNTMLAAQALYASVGFRPTHTIIRKGKLVTFTL